MRVLWEKPGLSAVQVHNEVSKENHWSDGTTRTYLRRLVEKGAVRYQQDENDEDNESRSFTLTADVERNIFSPSLGTTVEDAVSLRSAGPGCQMAIYLKRLVVEQTGVNLPLH